MCLIGLCCLRDVFNRLVLFMIMLEWGAGGASKKKDGEDSVEDGDEEVTGPQSNHDALSPFPESGHFPTAAPRIWA